MGELDLVGFPESIHELHAKFHRIAKSNQPISLSLLVADQEKQGGTQIPLNFPQIQGKQGGLKDMD